MQRVVVGRAGHFSAQRKSEERRRGRRGGDAETDKATRRRPGVSQSPRLPISPSPLIPVILVNCNRSPKPNVAVQRVDLAAAMPVTGLPMKATATLLNTSTVAQQRVVELLIDGVRQSASPELNLPPLGRVKHEFTFTLNRGGLHRGEVRLVGEDGSKYDDRRFFALEVDQGIPVAVVKAAAARNPLSRRCVLPGKGPRRRPAAAGQSSPRRCWPTS